VRNEQDFDSIGRMETSEASFDHLLRENPMGETSKEALRLDFDRRLKLEFHGTKVTSDAGLLAYWAIESHPGLCGGRMTDNGAKIRAGDEKSLVKVRRKTDKMLDFQRLDVF